MSKQEANDVVMKDAKPGLDYSEFDLDSYVSNYTGSAKIQRLIFVADRAQPLAKQALEIAATELKNTNNTTLYRKVCEKIGPNAMDDKWVSETDRKCASKFEVLEQELSSQKNTLIAESIRMCLVDLANFHHSRGDLDGAIKCHLKTRECKPSPKHKLSMFISIIKLYIESKKFNHAASYVSKALQTSMDLLDKPTLALLNACAGISHLASGKFGIAANYFIQTSMDLGTNFNDIISQRDVALYGGLCALVEFRRSDLKQKVLDNPEFKNYLDLMPKVRDLIADFHASRYSSCLSALQKMQVDLKLDLYFASHATRLISKIRKQAIQLYFSPFLSVRLSTMAQAFNSDVDAFEKEISSLIIEGKIFARIDSHNKILYAQQNNQQQEMFNKASRMAEEYERNTAALILRVNVIQNDLFVRPSRREKFL